MAPFLHGTAEGDLRSPDNGVVVRFGGTDAAMSGSWNARSPVV